MVVCSVSHCQNSTEKGYRLFGFPLNDEIKLECWKNNMCNPNWKINRKSKICEAHFLENSFEFKIAVALHEDTVPTIFKVTDFCSKQSLNILNISDLVSKVEELQVSALQREKVIRTLQSEIANLRSSLAVTKSNLTMLDSGINGVFNKNQIHNLTVYKRKGKRWSNATVEKALKMKFVCGTSGYEYMLKLNFPLPSVRTLSCKIQHILFKPGILEEMFYYLALKIQSFNNFERDCSLFLDEMSIMPGKEYCTASSSVMGNETLLNLDQTATHLLVVMLGGINLRWKQVVGYHFTGDSVNGNSLAKFVSEIIVRSDQLGLNVINVTSDMGPANQAMWKHFGVKSTKTLLTNSMPNPNDVTKTVYFIADVPHLFKNIRSSLINNKIFVIPDDFVQKYQLPGNTVDVKHIKMLAEFQDEMDLQLAPKLTPDLLHLNHFNKMKVAKAHHVLNQDVSAALNFLSQENVDECNKDAATTAWFVGVVYKWFCLLTSRTEILALSKESKTKYDESLGFLKEIIILFKNIKIGDKATWKPIQSGIILSTKSILDIQDSLLNTHKYKYLYTSRFSQDVLENIFSKLRIKQAVPNAMQCRYLLKNLSVFQFLEMNPKSGNYATCDYNNIMNFEEMLKPSKTTSETVEKIPLPFNWNDIRPNLNSIQLNCLYNSAGYILKRVKKNLKCNLCIKFIYANRLVKPFSKLVCLREFKLRSLTYASEDVFTLFKRMEEIFLNLIKHIPNKNFGFLRIFKVCVYEDEEIRRIAVPQCHTIKLKIINMFCLYRVRIYLAKLKRKTRFEAPQHSQFYKGSKSVESKVVLHFNP